MRLAGRLEVGGEVASRFDAAEPTSPTYKSSIKFCEIGSIRKLRTASRSRRSAGNRFAAIFPARDVAPTCLQPAVSEGSS